MLHRVTVRRVEVREQVCVFQYELTVLTAFVVNLTAVIYEFNKRILYRVLVELFDGSV
jgi:hypothetical protein